MGKFYIFHLYTISADIPRSYIFHKVTPPQGYYEITIGLIHQPLTFYCIYRDRRTTERAALSVHSLFVMLFWWSLVWYQ
jgi:hypothetical protein